MINLLPVLVNVLGEPAPVPVASVVVIQVSVEATQAEAEGLLLLEDAKVAWIEEGENGVLILRMMWKIHFPPESKWDGVLK